MDATTLRIVLLVAGLAFLAGIYLYETNRRKRESAQARRRVTPEIMPPAMAETEETVIEPEPAPESPDDSDTWVNWDDDEEDTEVLEKEFRELEGLHADSQSASEADAAEIKETAPDKQQQQELFGFSAREESPVDVPKLLIQINLRAKSEPFTGPAIQKAMRDTGMMMGEVPVYQRISGDTGGAPLFNLASMVEPGVFPTKGIESFQTPGLTLFTQLPGPGDGMAIFSDMLFTAERLAAILGGELQDETHSALTKQTIEHLRGQIMEHRRQVQLARSKG
ncbi:MAG: cell division protein ZipA [Candidatus Thiodiazotropha sp. (ex Dulcina madagascariensis)]|nr:cell division protein ZipA [Candidatus Thiodiazotropha sp. (ex Dulcina madagascariensis)]MCU7926796.1 cell division protein ZipA [Candidatus Thiodiazotropha sp. (ex Dulcina madagascariensis)]